MDNWCSSKKALSAAHQSIITLKACTHPVLCAAAPSGHQTTADWHGWSRRPGGCRQCRTSSLATRSSSAALQQPSYPRQLRGCASEAVTTSEAMMIFALQLRLIAAVIHANTKTGLTVHFSNVSRHGVQCCVAFRDTHQFVWLAAGSATLLEDHQVSNIEDAQELHRCFEELTCSSSGKLC